MSFCRTRDTVILCMFRYNIDSVIVRTYIIRKDCVLHYIEQLYLTLFDIVVYVCYYNL